MYTATYTCDWKGWVVGEWVGRVEERLWMYLMGADGICWDLLDKSLNTIISCTNCSLYQIMHEDVYGVWDTPQYCSGWLMVCLWVGLSVFHSPQMHAHTAHHKPIIIHTISMHHTLLIPHNHTKLSQVLNNILRTKISTCTLTNACIVRGNTILHTYSHKTQLSQHNAHTLPTHPTAATAFITIYIYTVTKTSMLTHLYILRRNRWASISLRKTEREKD